MLRVCILVVLLNILVDFVPIHASIISVDEVDSLAGETSGTIEKMAVQAIGAFLNPNQTAAESEKNKRKIIYAFSQVLKKGTEIHSTKLGNSIIFFVYCPSIAALKFLLHNFFSRAWSEAIDQFLRSLNLEKDQFSVESVKIEKEDMTRLEGYLHPETGENRT